MSCFLKGSIEEGKESGIVLSVWARKGGEEAYRQCREDTLPNAFHFRLIPFISSIP
jgi:hypothetical protein